MAGILGGAAVGMAKKVGLFSFNVLGCNRAGDAAHMPDSLDWVYHVLQKPAVVSISIGLDVMNPVLDEAIGQLSALDIVVLVAIGNTCLTSMSHKHGQLTRRVRGSHRPRRRLGTLLQLGSSLVCILP